MAADKIIRNTKLDTFLTKLATKLASIFWRKAETTQITIDSTPTASSTNLVTSGGVKSYVDGAIPSVPVTDVTVGGTSVVSSGTAVIPAIPTVPVTDVTVGGTSVVSNGTAVIPSIPTVPVTDVTVGGTSVVSSGTAVIPAIPDEVEANPTVPSGTTPTSLTGLKLGTDYYSVPSGGSANYEIANTVSDWNTEVRAGSATPSVTLPSPTGLLAEEIRYIFTAATASASFTAPSGYILADEDGFAGLSAGNTLSYSALTTGSIYECSFAVLDATHIALIMKEHKTA